jgi:hypothetical protein
VRLRECPLPIVPSGRFVVRRWLAGVHSPDAEASVEPDRLR